jgi:Domain of unknown function (DUF4917)
LKQARDPDVKSAALAVHSVHVDRSLVSDASLKGIRDYIRTFDFVYSTNYDLLMYWAIMSEDPTLDFVDYFWGEAFDSLNTEVWGDRTRILYLHGALHL